MRKLFPDEGSRFTYRLDAKQAVVSAAGARVVVYANAAGSAYADVRAYDGTETPGAAVAGSALTVDSYSQIPLFWGPEGADTVWVSVSGGPLTPVHVRNEALQSDVNLAIALGLAL